MLDLVFGMMLATSALNDPMDYKGFDQRGADRLPVAVATIEPAAGGTSYETARVGSVAAMRQTIGGGDR